MRRISIWASLALILLFVHLVSAETIMTENFAYVNHDRGSMKQEPHTIGNGTKAMLTINHKTSYKTFDICLDFPVNTDQIIINNMQKKGKLFNRRIELLSRDTQRICFDKVKLDKDNEFDLDISYVGYGKIKYNVTLIPSKYNKHYISGKFNNDIIILDPYIIGSLGTDSNYTIHYAFDNNLNPTKGQVNASYIYCGKSCKQFYDFRITQTNRSLANTSLNGTMYNMTFTQSGAWFNGSNYMLHQYNNCFNSTNFTIMIKTIPYKHFASFRGVYTNRPGAEPPGSISIYATPTDFQASLMNDTTGCTLLDVPYTQDIEQTYIIRYHGNNISAFLDGVYIDSVECERFKINEGQGWNIGSIGATAYYNGTISQLAYYNRSLTDQEISIISNQGNYTSNEQGESSKAIYFNGNDFIITQNSSLYPVTQRTVSYWIKAPVRATLFWQGIFGYGGIQSYGQLCQEGSSTLWNEYNGGSASSTGATPCDNEWHHVANVYTNSQIQTYIDGIIKYDVASALTTGAGLIPTIGTTPLALNNSMKGIIDEFIIYNRSLSATEVVRLAAGYGQYIIFNFFDEGTGATVNNITLKIQSESYSHNFSTETGSIAINLPANEVIGVRYNGTVDYSERFSYFNATQYTYLNRSLFLLNTSQGTGITVTVLDQIQRLIEEAYVDLLRYNLSTNDYYIVDSCKSDSEGICKFSAELNSEYYRFAVYYPFDNLVLYTSPSYIYSTALELQINTVESILSDFDVINGIYTNLQYDNSSNLFEVGYFDTTAGATDYKLEVYEVTPLSTNLITSNSSTSSIGNMIASLTPSNDTTYVAEFSAEVDEDYTIIDTESFRSNPISFGKFGLFLILLLTMVIPFTAVFSMSVAVILTPIPLLIGAIINIIPGSLLGILIFFEILAIVVAIIINK